MKYAAAAGAVTAGGVYTKVQSEENKKNCKEQCGNNQLDDEQTKELTELCHQSACDQQGEASACLRQHLTACCSDFCESKHSFVATATENVSEAATTTAGAAASIAGDIVEEVVEQSGAGDLFEKWKYIIIGLVGVVSVAFAFALVNKITPPKRKR